jgi:hypothetical protein
MTTRKINSRRFNKLDELKFDDRPLSWRYPPDFLAALPGGAEKAGWAKGLLIRLSLESLRNFEVPLGTSESPPRESCRSRGRTPAGNEYQTTCDNPRQRALSLARRAAQGFSNMRLGKWLGRRNYVGKATGDSRISRGDSSLNLRKLGAPALAEDNFALNGGKNMNCKIVSAAAVCLFTALSARAQSTRVDDIVGVGTPNYIPSFTGSHKIGNSNVFQTGGNVGIGTTTPDSTLRVFNPLNSVNASGLEPYAIYATLPISTINFSSAIRGDALGASGGVSGVIGLTNSHDGSGVNGVDINPDGGGYGVIGALATATTTNGGGGGGVLGNTVSTDGFTTGVRGAANGTTGGGVGVFGEAHSPEGSAGLFINYAGGNILQGNVGGANLFRVDGSGTVYANGGFQPSGADFAESMAVVGDRSKYAAGDLLVIEPTANRHLALSQQPYSSLVAGIYSTKPGILGSTQRVDETPAKDEVPLAVVGIVPCKLTSENGPIQVGDLLVSSSTPGHAMLGTDRARMLGAVVGKALEPLSQGNGVIQVLVTLQ